MEAHGAIAYKAASLPIMAAIDGAISIRPDQLLELHEVVYLVLPAFDADVIERIAGAMQRHQRHEPALQREIDIRARIAETFEQAAHAARPACGHEGTGPEQIIVAEAGQHVAEIDQSGDAPLAALLRQGKVF